MFSSLLPPDSSKGKREGRGRGRLTFGDVVGNLEGVGGILEGDEGDELDLLCKLGDLVDRVLDALDGLANLLCELGGEDGETGGRLEEEL